MKAVFGKGERKEWKEDHQTFQKGEREKRGRKKEAARKDSEKNPCGLQRLVSAPAYFPGPLPAKYLGRKWA